MPRRRWGARKGLVTVLLLFAAAGAQAQAAETVAFRSSDKTLHGLLYRPPGAGPFPTVLYNHGSAPGDLSTQAFDLLGPLFNAHGWAFFAPYRRGQGLSSDAGAYIGGEIADARARGGLPLAVATMVHLLSTEQLQDQLAAKAWLNRQPFVIATRVAVMGNSFGGIETVLGAERIPYCAAVDVAGGAESWDLAPSLQALLKDAAQHAKAPMLFIQAKNDYTTAPSQELYGAMRAAGLPAAIHLYPAFGSSSEDGHSFAWRGGSIWGTDVFEFLHEHCGKG